MTPMKKMMLDDLNWQIDPKLGIETADNGYGQTAAKLLVLNPGISPVSDGDLLSCYKNELEVVRDCLPGNYLPTPEHWGKIAEEIIERLDRYRRLSKKA